MNDYIKEFINLFTVHTIPSDSKLEYLYDDDEGRLHKKYIDMNEYKCKCDTSEASILNRGIWHSDGNKSPLGLIPALKRNNRVTVFDDDIGRLICKLQDEIIDMVSLYNNVEIILNRRYLSYLNSYKLNSQPIYNSDNNTIFGVPIIYSTFAFSSNEVLIVGDIKNSYWVVLPDDGSKKIGGDCVSPWKLKLFAI